MLNAGSTSNTVTIRATPDSAGQRRAQVEAARIGQQSPAAGHTPASVYQHRRGYRGHNAH